MPAQDSTWLGDSSGQGPQCFWLHHQLVIRQEKRSRLVAIGSAGETGIPAILHLILQRYPGVYRPLALPHPFPPLRAQVVIPGPQYHAFPSPPIQLAGYGVWFCPSGEVCACNGSRLGAISGANAMAKIASSHPAKCPKHPEPGDFTKNKGGVHEKQWGLIRNKGVSPKTREFHQKTRGYDKNKGVSTQTRGFHPKQGGFKKETNDGSFTKKRRGFQQIKKGEFNKNKEFSRKQGDFSQKRGGFQPKEGGCIKSSRAVSPKIRGFQPKQKESQHKRGGFKKQQEGISQNKGVSTQTRGFQPEQGGFTKNKGGSNKTRVSVKKGGISTQKREFHQKQDGFTQNRGVSIKKGRFNQNYRVSTKRRGGLLKIRVFHQKIRVFHQK